MRVVLACWGSYGDLFPSLSVAKALAAHGHDAVVATCPYYQSIVEREGLTFRPVRPDVEPSNTEIMKRVMDPARGSEVVVREIIGGHIREAYADLSAAVAGADVLISHPATFAAPIVAEERGLRWFSTALAPVTFFSVHDFPLLPPHVELMRLARLSPWIARGFMRLARLVTRKWTEQVRVLRRERGLPDAPDPLYEGQFSPFGTLALFSCMLGAPQPDWPAEAVVTGFPWFDGDATLPDGLAEFLDAGEPPIVFTLGTSAVFAPGAFYAESVRAARAVGRRAVLLVGRPPAGSAPASWPEDVFAAEFVSHAALFPRAAVVVHQGGVGTTGQALRAGAPTLVVPHAHDQPDNADRIVRLGVGQAIDARKYTAARGTSALRALLDDPRYAARAREVGAVVSSERGAEAACDVIIGGP